MPRKLNILTLAVLAVFCLLPLKGFSDDGTPAAKTEEVKSETKAVGAEAAVGPVSQTGRDVVPEAKYVGSSTCAMCHEKQNREFQLSPHSRVSVSEAEGVAQGCEMCHGAGSLHVDQGGGKGTMQSPNKNPELCLNCHIDKKAQFRLPYRHPVMEGHMSCSDCHDSHGSDTRPGTVLSLEGKNDTCFKCHKDQRGPFIFEHEALRDGCATCHEVHGSIHDKMLLVRDANLCFRCHAQTDYPNVGNRSHTATSGFTQGPCFSGGCHTAVHGSNFDDHLRY